MYSNNPSAGAVASITNSVITVYVAYQVSSTATISNTHPITLTATMGCSGRTSCAATTSTVTNTITVISQNAETVVSLFYSINYKKNPFIKCFYPPKGTHTSNNCNSEPSTNINLSSVYYRNIHKLSVNIQ